MDLTPRIVYKNYVFNENANYPQYGNNMIAQQQPGMQPVNVNYLPLPNVPIITYRNNDGSINATAAGSAVSSTAPGVYPSYYQPAIAASASPPYQFNANIPQTTFYDTQQQQQQTVNNNNNNINNTHLRVNSGSNFRLPSISSIMGSNNNINNTSTTAANSDVMIDHAFGNNSNGNKNNNYSSSKSSPITPRNSIMVMVANPLVLSNAVSPIYQQKIPAGPLTPPMSVPHSPMSSEGIENKVTTDAESITPTAVGQSDLKITEVKPERKSRRKKFICDGIGKHLSPEVRQKKECPICGKKCSRPSTLKTHYLIHTGDNPFCCTRPGCNKSFNVKSNLQRHIRSHDKKLSETLKQSTQIPIQLPCPQMY
ncbi:hypothetical protein C6P45_001984 [Maudiozyma exigua]|uniref:C2H2-type domain-containing protein n=1 Tax=Maudiozyma exigua TaxID=34358 RepID=A0A9P6WFE9_MAUEX|nr:hypothetical protein C6P45_001984 [Kazachstania exigua]